MRVYDFFRDDLKLTDEALLQKLTDSSQIEHLEKGQLLIETVERQTQISFLMTGILRGFLLGKEGQDITDCFACHRGEAAMGCNRLGGLSMISIEAITNAEVLMVPVAVVLELMDHYIELQKIYNRYLTEALERYWEEKILLSRCPAVERYRWLLRTYPGLEDQISGKHIASYLGMTPVSLSRIRRQLRENPELSGGVE